MYIRIPPGSGSKGMKRVGLSAVQQPVHRRIVASARAFFFAHGLRGVSMDDLAAELGMSKKTLYAHFPSKAALLESVVLDKFGDVENDVKRITSSHDDFLKILHRLLACLQEHAMEIQPAFLRDVRREAPELFTLAEDKRRRIIQRHFGKLLNEGKRAGIVRKDVSTAVVIEILLGAWRSMLEPSIMAELGMAPQKIITSLLTVVMQGVIVRKGST